MTAPSLVRDHLKPAQPPAKACHRSQRLRLVVGTAGLAGLVVAVTRRTFFSAWGPVVVDYWAFAAGSVLVAEGFWRLCTAKEQTLTLNLFRVARILIGVCILTIYFLQFVRAGRLGG